MVSITKFMRAGRGSKKYCQDKLGQNCVQMEGRQHNKLGLSCSDCYYGAPFVRTEIKWYADKFLDSFDSISCCY